MSRQPDPIEALAALAQERRSGVLSIKHERLGANICLQDGRVVFATSNLKRFQPGRWLVDARLTDQEALSTIGSADGTRALVDQLVSSFKADRLALVTALRALIKEITLDAISWNRSELRFSPGMPVLREQLLLDETLTGLLEEVEERLEAEAVAEGHKPGRKLSANRRGQSVHAGHPEVIAFRQKIDAARELNHYDLLEVDNLSEVNVIRRRYYQLARQFHPDALEGVLAEACHEDAEEYFSMVTEAYNTLTRPKQREEYDQQLRQTTGQEQQKQNPSDLAQRNFQQGRRALARGQLHDATQFFRNAVQLDESKPEYHRELGIVQLQNPRWQKSAEECLRRAVEMEQTDVRALVHLGRLYQKNGLKRRAIETFRNVLQWDPENDTAVEALASLETAEESGRGGLKGIFGRRT